MPEVSGSVTVEATPDAAWALLADVGGLDTWMPLIEECEWDDETTSRTLTLGGGLGTLVEKILEVDDANRTLRYTITAGPFVPDRHEATWTVVPAGDGATVTWAIDVEPQEMADMMAGMIDGALQAVKTRLES